jgi:hypothetical protein
MVDGREKRQRRLAHRRYVPLLATSCAAALAVGGVSVARDLGKKIDNGTARGDFAVASASGNVDEPRKLLMRVRSRPPQEADANWAVTCSRKFGAGSKDGRFAGRTPIVKRLRMPYSKPDGCTVSGVAQLEEGGRVQVTLYAK